MKKLNLLFITVVFIFTAQLSAQTTLERYQKAEQFLPKNISKLTRNVNIRINPVEGTNDFWYKLQTEKGVKYYYFTGENIKSEEAFDHLKLAASLSEVVSKQISPDSLQLERLSFVPKEKKMNFRFDTLFLEVNLNDYKIVPKEKEKQLPKNQSESPDKKWIAEVKNYNLFLKNTESGEEFRLTDDGVEKYEYATPLDWYKLVDESKGDIYDPSIFVRWSDDSKKFVVSAWTGEMWENFFCIKVYPTVVFVQKFGRTNVLCPANRPLQKNITFSMWSRKQG